MRINFAKLAIAALAIILIAAPAAIQALVSSGGKSAAYPDNAGQAYSAAETVGFPRGITDETYADAIVVMTDVIYTEAISAKTDDSAAEAPAVKTVDMTDDSPSMANGAMPATVTDARPAAAPAVESVVMTDDTLAIESTAAEPYRFETNLPIVVMDMGGKEFHRSSVWSTEKGYPVSARYDPFIDGVMAIYDSGGGVNRLSDAPSLRTDIHARIRGVSSQGYPKKQYLIKTVLEDGAKNRMNIFDMGSDCEWVLNISFIDTTLLRNYLCYAVTREINGASPKARFCEVFVFVDGTYHYQGLYLFMESVKQGAGRVAIKDYDSGFAESSYLLRRDRYDEEAVILNTYGTRNGLTHEYLSVKYPPKDKITELTVSYIENDIDSFEKVLFAEDDGEFLKYRDFIDVESFVDYFIINEFFANYDANTHSMFSYKDLHGKLKMGPVWDFDQAIGNDAIHDLKIDSTAMHDGVWLRQLLRDAEFVRLMINRYAELRQGPLSEDKIMRRIDEAAAYIEQARIRDWDRWKYDEYFLSQSGAHDEVRNYLKYGGTYEEAVATMKATLREHGAWLDERLDTLYQYSSILPGQLPQTEFGPVLDAVFGNDHVRWASGALVVVFLAVFFTGVSLAQREN